MDRATISRTTVLSDHFSERHGAPILAGIIHATAGRDSLPWLIRNPKKVSAHLFIPKSGELIRMVPDSLAAHHCGYSRIVVNKKRYDRRTFPEPNQITLGMELENMNDGKDPYTPEQLFAMGVGLTEWKELYPEIQFFFHREVDTEGKTDPIGLSWADVRTWMQRATTNDPWQLWHDAGFYPNPTFAIEKHWLRAQSLGKPISREIYVNAFISIRGFEHGAILYHARRNDTEEIR